jgi:hypothetical protein
MTTTTNTNTANLIIGSKEWRDEVARLHADVVEHHNAMRTAEIARLHADVTAVWTKLQSR